MLRRNNIIPSIHEKMYENITPIKMEWEIKIHRLNDVPFNKFVTLIQKKIELRLNLL